VGKEQERCSGMQIGISQRSLESALSPMASLDEFWENAIKDFWQWQH
jgi:hypothetical protein